MIRFVAGLLLIWALSANAEEHCFDVEEVIKVVDGDTLDVRLRINPFSLLTELRIRLLGIDAYESRTRDLAIKVLGLAAKSRLTDLLIDGPVKVCLAKKGKFGRWLGIVYAGDINVNDQLLIEGHAKPYGGGNRG